VARRDELEELVKEMQQRIDQEEERIYSAVVRKEVQKPFNMGSMEGCDAAARYKGSCGDTMEIFLRVKNDCIVEASFLTDGCGTSVACGSRLMRMILGIGIAEAWDIGDANLISELEGLPDDSLHCATLAVTTLRKALKILEERR
jgi:nitrogen fixation NifU-like protein